MSKDKPVMARGCWIVMIGPQWCPVSVYTTEAAAREHREHLLKEHSVIVIPSTIYDEAE